RTRQASARAADGSFVAFSGRHEATKPRSSISTKRVFVPSCFRGRSLPPEYVTFTPYVGAAAKGAALRFHADGDDAGAHAVRAEHLQLVAARRERIANVGRNAILDFEHAGLARVGVERSERVQRVDARRFDRLLDVAAEDEHLEQHIENLLILAVAAGRADGQERLALLEH